MVLVTMQVFWGYDAVSLGEEFLTFQIGLLDAELKVKAERSFRNIWS
jgi:hypothetical protein